MIKIYNKTLDETYYREVLTNGLEVTIFHKPDFLMSACALGTPFGALDIEQNYKGEHLSFHSGIAHFLEHKLFEAEGKDITGAFSALGASVNAFTSYRETVYYFSTTLKDLKEPLSLLLDFVQDLDISEESVEKEKGIIIQEMLMYQQIPESRLMFETYQSLYHTYPLRYDIAGDKESIQAIDKEELEDCYAINYHPANMKLVITTPVDPEEIINIVKQNQNGKSFPDFGLVCRDFSVEPVEPVRKQHSFHADVSKDTNLYAIKLPIVFNSTEEACYAEWCMRILLSCHFSPINPEYQIWMDQERINDYFGFEVDFDREASSILFYMEGGSPQDLFDLVNGSLKQDLLDEETLKQIKRRFIGSSLRSFNDIESFNSGFIRDLLNGIDFFEMISMISGISIEDIYGVFRQMDFSHYSLIHMGKVEK